ncbi:hypothetical protein PPACK8108_LOCUS2311 [Phakopsora pachyrhizi]|uniref:Secreted protein n=1 Tax=Phakopsora pachyrhizi TaxID=170000 RepID=A0AAV0AI30_PHAPC|nr:hypothetical protein PPACK8108_LOCUS2311 [Phakopsora pachyrhizi]
MSSILGIALLALLLIPSQALALFNKQPEYNNWSNSQDEKWLTDHKIPNPGNLDSNGLLNLDNYHDTSKFLRDSAIGAQKVLQKNSDSLFSSWTDSHLQDFLLNHGVVSPANKLDELIRASKRYLYSGTKSASLIASAATDAASNAGSVAYIKAADATRNAGSVAYDAADSTANSTGSAAYNAAANVGSDGYDAASNPGKSVYNVVSKGADAVARATQQLYDYLSENYDDTKNVMFTAAAGIMN